MWLTESDEPRHNTSQVERLGEFGIIAHLSQGLETRPDVVLAAGDDAALLDTGASSLLVATCDAQVEGIHFVRGIATLEEIGHKALAVNLSDIAAMGAEPRWALVSLLLPSEVQVLELDRIYAGMRALANQYSVALVGGNISSSPGPLCLDVTLLGAVERSCAVRRQGARIGDAIVVTGALGAAAAGALWSVADPDPGLFPSLSMPTRERTRRAMVAPSPQLAEGRALAASGAVSTMIDVSDGLAADLWHICEASHVGAILEAESLPLDPSAQEVARVYGHDPFDLALHGGEDYVLLSTVKEEAVELALTTIAAVGGRGYVIGRVVSESAGMNLRLRDGQLVRLPPQGWDHLRRKS